MKRIFTVLLLVITISMAFAQRHPSGRGDDVSRYYGIRVGASFSNINCNLPEINASTMKGGLNLGAVVGFPFTPNVPAYFETGIRLVEKGGIVKTDDRKLRVNGTYFEVPLQVKYRIDIDEDFALTPSLGGYLSLGLGGRIKDYGLRQTYHTFSSDYYERFEGGLHLGCALSYDIFSVELDYQYGLSNISHSAFDTAHSNSLYLLLGVTF